MQINAGKKQEALKAASRITAGDIYPGKDAPVLFMAGFSRQYEDREHFVILTTPYDVTDVEMADRVFLALSETVGNRLRADQVQIEVVSVGIKYAGTIISTVP